MALTDIKVRAAKPTDKQYKLTDGGGMHLLVHPNGSKYWRLQYRYEGKQKMLALGVYPEITLADARVRRDEARKLLANGVDPGDKKKNDKVEQSKARTFKEVAIEWHGTNKKWSEDHAHRVLKSLEDNLFAALGERNIAELKTRDLLAPIVPFGFAPIFPDTCYHLTHYWLAAVDIPVASDNPVHYADAIRYNARMPLQGSLLPLTRLVWA